MAMMTSRELGEHLSALRLSAAEAAQLLNVSARTVRRWVEGEEVPGPAEAAFRAWRILEDRNLPWKPDAVSLIENDQDQIERHRKHAQEFAELVKVVDGRGGPKNPWTVDLVKSKATFGPYEIGFYRLLNDGGFSLSTYRRKDTAPDVERDALDIQDAAFCIAKAIKQARASNQALKAVAQYTRQNASLSAQDKAKPVDPTARMQTIITLADKIDDLAARSLDGLAKYDQFETLLNELHAAGFFPEMSLISDVARSFVW